MVLMTRTDKNRADRTKAAGIVYTPPVLARFLAARALDALGKIDSVRVLDPACGDGELLLATSQIAAERGIRVAQITGYDTDPYAIEAAHDRLNASVNLHCEDFLDLSSRSLDHNKLFDSVTTIERARFDVIVSNPPYVRTQTLGTSVAQSLARHFGLEGRIDLYHAFIIAMIRSLDSHGAIGLLCSNKFLTNRTGSSLRSFLMRELEIEEVVDLGDTKLFDAAVLPAIVSGRCRQNSRAAGARRFRSVYEATPDATRNIRQVQTVLAALDDDLSGLVSEGDRIFHIRDGILDPGDDPRDPWNPIDAETVKHFNILRSRASARLKDLVKVRVGVKTTADSVYIRSNWNDLPDEIRPEAELLHPLITHRDVHPWSCEPGSRHILYPHSERQGRTCAVDLGRYPRAGAYLELHRERLENRKYIRDAGREWFEVWVPQKPSLWSQQKIVFPDISLTPKFSIDRSGAIVNGDCYWMVVDDADLAEVITAVGNSSFCTWFYDAACGNFLYSGRRRFMTQYIERLPIPEATPLLISGIRECRHSKSQADIDRLIWSSLGFKEPLR